MGLRIAVDIGGTFTDVVAADEETGRATAGKVLTTVGDLSQGVLDAVGEVTERVSDISFFVHGTTQGLNAFLERKGPRTLLLTTAGLADAYSIARGDRRDLYTLKYRKPQRLVPRRDVHEVAERIATDGSVLVPLDLASLDPIVEKIGREGIEAVAICLINAYIEPRHEDAVAEHLAAHCPGVTVTCSHDITREWREYERASTTILSAYIAPKVQRYLTHLEGKLDDAGLQSPLYVMQSNGGVATASATRRLPIQTLLSGPVGGVMGGVELSRVTERPNLLCVDMGGTSFDVSLIVSGRPDVTSESELEGLPILMPLVNVHTVGAGGGSIAWVEAGGLRVGPQSAGAEPGPVCYGGGGTEPTVTDANLVLGRLDAGDLLKGRLPVDVPAAEAAVDRLGEELGMGRMELADGILAVVNARMADAIRTMTVSHGIDPRDFAMVAYGGAGPMHAVFLAEELKIPEVVVPANPGTFSAFGMLGAEMRRDLSRVFYRATRDVDAGTVRDVFVDLEAQGRAALRDEGVDDARISFRRGAQMRYVGQEYSVTVELPEDAVVIEDIERSFHEVHATRYGHSTPGAPCEFVTLRVAAVALIGAGAVAAGSDQTDGAPAGTRDVVFDGVARDTPFYRRARLGSGWSAQGPAIIEDDTATTVVPPGWSASVDELGNLVITREGEQG